MTENLIANNITLCYAERNVKSSSPDVLNVLYYKHISICKDSRDDSKTKYSGWATTIRLSDYPQDPSKFKPDYEQFEIKDLHEVANYITDLIKNKVFLAHPECEEVIGRFHNVSTGETFQQVFYRKDPISLLSSCWSDNTGKTNNIALDDILSEYTKMFVKLFTAENIRNAASYFKSLTGTVTDLISSFKK